MGRSRLFSFSPALAWVVGEPGWTVHGSRRQRGVFERLDFWY